MRCRIDQKVRFLALLLAAIREHGPVTSVEAVRLTGQHRDHPNVWTQSLEAWGLVERVPIKTKGRYRLLLRVTDLGRPAIPALRIIGARAAATLKDPKRRQATPQIHQAARAKIAAHDLELDYRDGLFR